MNLFKAQLLKSPLFIPWSKPLLNKYRTERQVRAEQSHFRVNQQNAEVKELNENKTRFRRNLFWRERDESTISNSKRKTETKQNLSQSQSILPQSPINHQKIIVRLKWEPIWVILELINKKLKRKKWHWRNFLC